MGKKYTRSYVNRAYGPYSSLRQALKSEPDNLELKLHIRARKRHAQIKSRCENKKGARYYRYGGRGIELRIDIEEFVNWYIKEVKKFTSRAPSNWSDRSRCPSVDRINNDGHYEFGNIRIIGLSENVKKMYKDSVIKRPHLSISNTRLKSRAVKVEGINFLSITSAKQYFGRSSCWVISRLEV